MSDKETTRTPTFHYHTKEEVRKGDIVRTGNRSQITGNRNEGIVVLVIAPRSEDADAYDCWDEGCILIEEDWDGTPSLLIVPPPDGIYWEDLDLIQRSNKEGGLQI